MLKNENHSIVKKLTSRTMKVNRSRNYTLIAAIALTTLLISSVFSIGMSYLKSVELQQIRLMGTTAHAAVTSPTDEQVEKIRTLSYVKTVGLQHNVALIQNTKEMGNMNLGLHWFDKAEWEQFRVPAAIDIVGRYPDKYNEIIVPLWILHNMGVDDPQIGMKIPLSFFLGDDRSIPQKETFVLSGYYTEYMYIRSGNVGTIKVSEEFAQKSGNCVEKSGAATVSYKDSKHIDQYNKQLERDLSLMEDQKVKTVPMYETSEAGSSTSALAFAAVIFFLMFTGYLLIYNVLYISVSKDIRYYGLLKAIGTTPGQLKKIVMGQALRLAAIGIPIGLADGAILSFVVVPMALGMFKLETGVEISFSPVIFIGAVFFTLLTTMIGAAKPARVVAKISPLEALRFTGANTGGKRKHSTGGGKPLRMAWRNIFRDRKRAAVVLLSLFLGITTFMGTTMLISSMDTDNYIASYVDNDFILMNNTLDAIGNASGKPQKQKFDAVFMSQLDGIEGLTNLRTTTREQMSMKYDPKQFSRHIEEFRIRFRVKDELTQQNIQDNFWGYIIGIDDRYVQELNKNSKKTIDLAAFKRGEVALIGTNNTELYANVDVMEVMLTDTGETTRIPLRGFVPWGFQYAGGGLAPNIYVSEEALQKLVPNPKIYKVSIDVENDLEEQALEKIKALTNCDYEISRTSKLEQQEAMSDTKLMMYILGGGIALVLALIGILNFINVMSIGVMVRKMEFAMLESIGMTKRQICRMLMLEGLGYAGITTVLVGTLGSIVTFCIFKLFQQQADYAIFTFPFIPMLIATTVVFITCAVTPKMAYQTTSRASIIERLRETE